MTERPDHETVERVAMALAREAGEAAFSRVRGFEERRAIYRQKARAAISVLMPAHDKGEPKP